VALCKGFGLKEGAVASSVAHDSHNIIAIGTDDEFLVSAINRLIEDKGGLVAAPANGNIEDFPLPIAGIMCHLSGEEAADKTYRLRKVVRAMGCHLPAPFMALSFLALVVIPEIKIGEKGLFSYSQFNWLE
jgi:adenine deaminase